MDNQAMIKHSNKLISPLLLGTLCFSLGSCGATSNGGDSKTYSFLVEFYDDASENKEECEKVGYAYVAYGQPVTSIQPYEDKPRYDEKSKQKPSKAGYRFKSGFSNIEWKGTYADIDASLPAYDHDANSENSNAKLPPSSGDEVDPTFIKGNCSLYANFVETPIQYRTRFYNSGSTIKGNDDKPFGYGKTYTLGDASDNFVSEFPENLTKDAKYGYINNFKGFGFKENCETPFGIGNTGKLTFSFGEGKPTAKDIMPGSIYEDIGKDENGYSLNLYGFDGNWELLGSANSNKPIEISYYANFSDDYKRTYEIQVYNSYEDYLDPSKTGSSIWGDYLSEITFTDENKTVNSETIHFDKNKTTSISGKSIRTWRGFYSEFVSYDNSFGKVGNDGDEKVPELYANKMLFNSNDENIVSAPMKIFPVYSDCEVKISGVAKSYNIAYGNTITFNGEKISFTDAEGKETTVSDLEFGIDNCEIKYQAGGLNDIVLPEECKGENYSLLTDTSKKGNTTVPVLGDIEISKK